MFGLKDPIQATKSPVRGHRSSFSNGYLVVVAIGFGKVFKISTELHLCRHIKPCVQCMACDRFANEGGIVNNTFMNKIYSCNEGTSEKCIHIRT